MSRQETEIRLKKATITWGNHPFVGVTYSIEGEPHGDFEAGAHKADPAVVARQLEEEMTLGKLESLLQSDAPNEFVPDQHQEPETDEGDADVFGE